MTDAPLHEGGEMETVSHPASEKRKDTLETGASTPLIVYLRVLLVGIFFGIVLVKSEVVRWQRVHDMFLFREAHMYLIITTGIVVAAISMQLIKRLGIKTIDGQPIEYQPKPYHKGVVLGGMLFGAGWAITGACPGPIYAQIGAGAWMALATLAGALLGMFAYAYAQPKLPH